MSATYDRWNVFKTLPFRGGEYTGLDSWFKSIGVYHKIKIGQNKVDI